MLHQINAQELGPRGEAMTRAIATCVHCGFCLPGCPTYQELESEMDSPRGRILLMKCVLEGQIDAKEAAPHIDRCLACMACVTNCPSGVQYGELVTSYRAFVNSKLGEPPRSLFARLRTWLAHATLPYPRRLRIALQVGRWFKWARSIMPRAFRPMVDLIPSDLPAPVQLDELNRPNGTARARVALLTGCGQQVLEPDINAAAVRVLLANDVEVVVPTGQGCCGALAWHAGRGTLAARFAARLMEAMPEDVDAYITTAAGCGSTLREYPLVLAGTDQESAAATFAHRCVDIAEFLDRTGIKPPSALAVPLRAVYQDACHLLHAQRIDDAPRRLLNSIEGLQLVEITDRDICCGSAGTYNIEHADIARRLGQRKVKAILQANPDLVITGNIGCLVQLRKHLELAGKNIPVLHTMQVLDKAYQGILCPRNLPTLPS